MSNLNINIDDAGVVRVSCGGIVVGFIKSLELRMDTNLHPVPHIHISFDNLHEARNSPEKTQLMRHIQHYKSILLQHPLIRVSDYHDTLPQGMPAVRPEDEEK